MGALEQPRPGWLCGSDGRSRARTALSPPRVPGLAPHGDPDPSRAAQALAPSALDPPRTPASSSQWASADIGQAGGESCEKPPPQRALLLSLVLPALSSAWLGRQAFRGKV